MGGYDSEDFKNKVEKIVVRERNILELHFKDGNVNTRTYIPPVFKASPRTEESKEHMRQVMIARWTAEKKAEMSEKMKAIRKERGKAWCKEK